MGIKLRQNCMCLFFHLWDRQRTKRTWNNHPTVTKQDESVHRSVTQCTTIKDSCWFVCEH